MPTLKVFAIDHAGTGVASSLEASSAAFSGTSAGAPPGPSAASIDGFAATAAPTALAALRHHQMACGALFADLAGVAGVELIAPAEGSFRQRFEAGVRAADAVWILAPPARGMLERLSREVLRSGRILLGSRPGALRVTASRRRSAHALARAGIDAVPTYAPGQRLPLDGGAWVVRPDAGAGWFDSHLFSSASAALGWIDARASATPGPAATPYVLQPFIPGKLGNLSLLCRDGAAQLLACNDQRVAMRDNQFHVLGTTVNSLADPDGVFEGLAQAVAAAIPGLWGYVGIDFVLAAQGVVVLEVSTHLGPAYAGLHASLGCNPAALVIDLLARPAGGSAARPKPLAVAVDLAAFDDA